MKDYLFLILGSSTVLVRKLLDFWEASFLAVEMKTNRFASMRCEIMLKILFRVKYLRTSAL